MTRFDTITAHHWRESIARSRAYINPVSAQIRAQLMQATSAKVPEAGTGTGRGAACANSQGGPEARGGAWMIAAQDRPALPFS